MPDETSTNDFSSPATIENVTKLIGQTLQNIKIVKTKDEVDLATPGEVDSLYNQYVTPNL